jgi:hypothetical protein
LAKRVGGYFRYLEPRAGRLKFTTHLFRRLDRPSGSCPPTS